MKTLKLTQNKVTIVDNDVYEAVSKFSWHYTKTGYAACRMTTKPNSSKIVLLHRYILNFPKVVIDHINGDKLDNRKSNLRAVGQSLNMFNKKTCRKTSQYRGVSWFKRDATWRATIMKDRKQVHLGYFKTELEAFETYLQACLEIYGFIPHELL